MGYRAVIYNIDGTVLNTLNMNMYPPPSCGSSKKRPVRTGRLSRC